MDIGKEARYHYSKAISGDSPSRMFTTGTATEVLSCHQYLAAVSWVVQYELLVYSSVRVITPIAEQVISKKLLVACGRLQETSRYNLVGIYIL